MSDQSSPRAEEKARPRGRGKIVAAATGLEPAGEALLRAQHGDPFAVLGPHKLASGLWEVRAVLPEALRARVLRKDHDVASPTRDPGPRPLVSRKRRSRTAARVPLDELTASHPVNTAFAVRALVLPAKRRILGSSTNRRQP